MCGRQKSNPDLHVALWNLFPFRKHFLGDSLHSHEHLVLLSGWCLGQVLVHTHWQLSLLKTWLGGQEEPGSVLQTHWQVFGSKCWLVPQLLAGTLRWHTHWQLSISSSLSGPHTSGENISVGKKGQLVSSEVIQGLRYQQEKKNTSTPPPQRVKSTEGY